MNKVEKIREEVEKIAKSINPFLPDEDGNNSEYEAGRLAMATQILQYIDSLQEEPVSNDLEEAAHSYVDTTIEWFDSEGNPCCYPAFKAGAQWQKERDQSTIELAEDHAYLAGQEKIIEKACEWLNNFYSEDRHCYFVEEDIDNFKKAMEE